MNIADEQTSIIITAVRNTKTTYLSPPAESRDSQRWEREHELRHGAHQHYTLAACTCCVHKS
jgi:hypothetical protein